MGVLCTPDKRPTESFGVPDGLKEELVENIKYFEGKTNRSKIWGMLPEEARVCEENMYVWL